MVITLQYCCYMRDLRRPFNINSKFCCDHLMSVLFSLYLYAICSMYAVISVTLIIWSMFLLQFQCSRMCQFMCVSRQVDSVFCSCFFFFLFVSFCFFFVVFYFDWNLIQLYGCCLSSWALLEPSQRTFITFPFLSPSFFFFFQFVFDFDFDFIVFCCNFFIIIFIVNF